MKFCGLQKTSLVDYPNRAASVLFTPGCNLRCPYCHNWRIVVDPKPPFLTEETALGILEGRKRYVDAVVVTGGEPTIHKEIPRFLKKLKERGFATKLDTNGMNSQALEECLSYVDFVALDVKSSAMGYERLGAKDTSELVRSIEMLKTGKIAYEFRTTVVPGLVNVGDIAGLGELVKGADTLALQQFISNDTLDKSFTGLEPYSVEAISDIAKTLKQYVGTVTLRI